jgi:hypothetical protein
MPMKRIVGLIAWACVCCILLGLGLWQTARLQQKRDLLDRVARGTQAKVVDFLGQSPKSSVMPYQFITFNTAVPIVPIKTFHLIRGQRKGQVQTKPFALYKADGLLFWALGTPKPSARIRPFEPLSPVRQLIVPPLPASDHIVDPTQAYNWLLAERETKPVYAKAHDQMTHVSYYLDFDSHPFNIPNNHLSYALFWYALAILWLGMGIVMGFKR